MTLSSVGSSQHPGQRPGQQPSSNPPCRVGRRLTPSGTSSAAAALEHPQQTPSALPPVAAAGAAAPRPRASPHVLVAMWTVTWGCGRPPRTPACVALVTRRPIAHRATLASHVSQAFGSSSPTTLCCRDLSSFSQGNRGRRGASGRHGGGGRGSGLSREGRGGFAGACVQAPLEQALPGAGVAASGAAAPCSGRRSSRRLSASALFILCRVRTSPCDKKPPFRPSLFELTRMVDVKENVE